METLVFRSAHEQPFLYQWEEAVPWKTRDKISKHDTTSFIMDNDGSVKVEFPTWLETITLADEKTQYLLALTEEGKIKIIIILIKTLGLHQSVLKSMFMSLTSTLPSR
jgi:hypothetical protein